MFGALLPFIPAIASGVGAAFGIGGANRNARSARDAQARAQAQSNQQAEQANRFLEQIPQIGQQQFNPYIQRGHEAQGRALEQYNKMSANPMDYINQIVAGYKPSEGYKFREQRALDAMRGTAAAGGLTGTAGEQERQGMLANNLAGQDIQEWLQNVFGVQGAGLAGQQHVADTGFHGAQSLADLLATAASERGGLAHSREQSFNQQAMQAQRNYQDAQAGKQQAIGGLFSSLGGLAQVPQQQEQFQMLKDILGRGSPNTSIRRTSQTNGITPFVSGHRNAPNLGQGSVIPNTLRSLSPYGGGR